MLSGNFFMTNFEETGEYNGEITFTTQLQSSGPWTYTPEAV
jgi:predicted secreted protein